MTLVLHIHDTNRHSPHVYEENRLLCTKKDTYPDGKEFVGVGIQPDIPVSKGLSDYIENKDPVLETAIGYLSERK